MRKWTRLKEAAAVLAMLSMTACSGGGGSDSAGVIEENPPPAPTQIGGQVADGYLRGAKVCLDINENKKCDIDEPTATTGAEGRYQMGPEVLGEFNAALYPVLVEVPETAIDEDTNAPVGKEYVLSAPAGKPEFVSPITTLVQNEIESNPGLTPEMAEKTVRDQIGVSENVSLFENYVAPAPEKAAELRTVHQVAQVVARTMADMKTQVEDAAAGAGVNVVQNYDAIVKLVVEEVMNRLQTIVTTVNTAQQSGGTFNPDTAAQTVATEAGTVESSTITQRIEEKKTVVVKGSFETMMEGSGVYWLEARQEEGGTQFEYGNIRKPADSSSPIDTNFVLSNGQWISETRDEAGYMLTTQGWLPFSDEAANFDVTFNADGTALLKHKTTGLEEKLAAVEYDLAGKSHGAFAGEVTPALKDPAATFPEGARAYRMNFVPQQGSYVYHLWTDDQGVDHNRIYYHDGQQEVVLSTLGEVKSVFSPTAIIKRYYEIQWMGGFSIAVQFGAEGQLLFFKRSNDYTQQPVQLEASGSWNEIVVAGETLLKMEIPETLKAMFRFSGSPFLVARDGKVRSGIYRPALVVEADKTLNFNKTAFDALVANVDFTYPNSVRLALKSVPLYGVEADSYDPYSPFLGYGEIGLDTLGAPVEKEYEYNFETKTWNLLTDDESDWVLSTAGTWVEADDLPQNFTFVHNADGTATLTHKTTGLRRTLSMTRQDLAGRPHSSAVMDSYSMLKSSMIAFPAGAFGYRPGFALIDGLWEVEKWEDDMGGDANFVTPATIADPSNPLGPPIGMATLADIPVVYGYGTGNYLDKIGFGESPSLHLQFGPGTSQGVVYCYRFEYVWDQTEAANVWKETVLPLQGEWSFVTVNGKQLLRISLPADYVEQYDVEGVPFIADFGNQVFKYGKYFAPGMEEEEQDILLNKVAFDSLKTNLKLELGTVTLLRAK